MLLLFLSACLPETYPDYWPKTATSPTVTDVQVISNSETTSDTEVVITGTHLQSTQTVVFGSRNATILQTSETSVQVNLSLELQSGEPLSLGLATKEGTVWLEDALVP